MGGGTYLDKHLFLCKSLDVSDSAGSSLLELDSLESLVEVEGVVEAGRLHFFSCLSHRNKFSIY